jgi:hypothetical protein
LADSPATMRVVPGVVSRGAGFSWDDIREVLFWGVRMGRA